MEAVGGGLRYERSVAAATQLAANHRSKKRKERGSAV